VTLAARTHVDAEQVIATWHDRPYRMPCLSGANALTVDVEDYFQVEAFFNHIDRNEWGSFECRVERNTDVILSALRNSGATATFFTLAWVASRYPSLIRRIVAAGHELASHGLEHRRADSQTPVELLDDVTRAKAILEDISGVAVNGYRAASFSITRSNLWAFEVLAKAGYRYSSSTYPIKHDLYGIKEAPRFAFYPLAGDNFVEVPLTTVRWRDINLPCAGGGYFRLLPYWLTARNLRAARTSDAKPCVFYFHPWEIDPEQPRIRGVSLKTRVRHYTNLSKTQPRLERLLRDFVWKRLDHVYPVTMDKEG
jgi:polysaccharide deacetylase family protein (PEP-CTERM system associated)